MVRLANLVIHKEEFAFSAGHFTIFSATEREAMHGHNYYVSVAFDFNIEGNGLSFDYRIYKKKIKLLCQQLDRHFLLPTLSPHLQIIEEDDVYIGVFAGRRLPFIKDDVVLLPITNITIEELSHWFLEQLLQHQADIQQHLIHRVTVHVYNGPGQSAAATWQALK